MSDKDFAKYRQAFARNHGILRLSTAIRQGVPHHALYKMVETGQLIREARGIYRLKEMEPPGNPDLVQIGLRVPKAVICLISALYFHRLTTEVPHRVHLALPRDVKAPRIAHPPIQVFHLTGRMYQAGIEEHLLDGVKVKIYSREKTIADCFKFRSRIGRDTALEALKDYLDQPRPDLRLLTNYAAINRVEKIMRPYLEALI